MDITNFTIFPLAHTCYDPRRLQKKPRNVDYRHPGMDLVLGCGGDSNLGNFLASCKLVVRLPARSPLPRAGMLKPWAAVYQNVRPLFSICSSTPYRPIGSRLDFAPFHSNRSAARV
jgi:hypothetical protein